jgi:hypothetical protein
MSDLGITTHRPVHLVVLPAPGDRYRLYFVMGLKKWWSGIEGATEVECIIGMQKMTAPTPEALAEALEQNGTTYP